MKWENWKTKGCRVEKYENPIIKDTPMNGANISMEIHINNNMKGRDAILLKITPNFQIISSNPQQLSYLFAHYLPIMCVGMGFSV